MFNNFFKRVKPVEPAAVPEVVQPARELPMTYAIKRGAYHTFVVTVDGGLIIEHKIGSDVVELNALEVRSLRNLLNNHGVRRMIGAPYTPTPPKSPERRARRAERRAAKKAAAGQGELLAYYEDMTSIDPGFAVPTDEDLEMLFQERRGLQRAS